MKTTFSDILDKLQDENLKSLERKLPEWVSAGAVNIPGKLALEQCSGSVAARRKAALMSGSVADLTGGLGADSWAFALNGCQVWYNERNSGLCDAAKENFRALGVDGRISVHCSEIDAGSVKNLPDFDWIYMDPARRAADGKKVFLLEDCSPDVLTLLPELKRHSRNIMIKLSPMADIAMLRERLGPDLKEIRIASADGEVKELLCIMRTDSQEDFRLTVQSGDAALSLLPEEEKNATATFPCGIDEGDWLFIPSAALQKAGAFKLISQRWGIDKLDASTQMYVSKAPVPGLEDFGHFRRIRRILPFGKEGFALAREYCPKAGVTARNLPLSSEGLAKKMGIKPGGDAHIYAVSTVLGRQLLIV